jgi:hypothetical protein
MKCHTYEEVELSFECSIDYANPYLDVSVWVDLEGPGFSRRVHGFWAGDRRFCVRLLAPTPGTWRWTSGASVDDSGLTGRVGEIEVEAWTDAELAEVPTRRGILKPSQDGRAFEFADGTPFFLIGDTWWATPTFRFPWDLEDDGESVGEMTSGSSFQQMVRFRKAQGYTTIAMIAMWPQWANDGEPSELWDRDGTPIRSAWQHGDTKFAQDMHNDGGRPFEFPGRVPGYESIVPDYDRINPAYFEELDRKLDFLNANGFVPFVEASRRDCGPTWAKYYDWPGSYTRYLEYLFARLQAKNVLLSPIHYDWADKALPARDYNESATEAVVRSGIPAFGQLMSTNASPSTLRNFGGPDEAPWLGFHQIGNFRAHMHFWYLTDIYRSDPPRPALHGEPFYPGFPHDAGLGYMGAQPVFSLEADRSVRASVYGSFLSGGYAGFIHGVQGLWAACREPGSPYLMWDVFAARSGGQVAHLETFAMCEGPRYRELVPSQANLTPCQAGDPHGYRGWAYCGITPDASFALCYFEAGCPERVTIRGLASSARYEARFFDPIEGAWLGETREIETTNWGEAPLPERPDAEDWGMALRRLA